MKTVRLHQGQKLLVHQESKPIPLDGEYLLRVRAVGLCGSDLHWFSEGGIGDAKLESPLILGHEFSAFTGDGRLVAVDPAIACGNCEQCQKGNPNLCLNIIFAGHGNQDGALREFINWPEKCLYPLPEGMSPADGAMLEPLGVAMHALDLARLTPGMRVGVIGCGPVGLLILQLVKLSGVAMVIATDKLTHRLAAARDLGADQAFLADSGRELGEIHKATKGHDLDVVFEVAGEKDAVDVSISAVIPGGKVLMVGIPAEDLTIFKASQVRHKEINIQWVHRMKNTYPGAISLVEKGLVDVRSLVTHHFPLEKAAEAFEFANKRIGLKVIVDV